MDLHLHNPSVMGTPEERLIYFLIHVAHGLIFFLFQLETCPNAVIRDKEEELALITTVP